MPEEIGIALVIIVIVGWLLIKILQAFGRAIGETLKGISDSLSAHSTARFTQSKSRFSQYVSVILPNQLDAAEQAVSAAQRNLQRSKEGTRWEACRSLWVREEF
jgi:uncharacterized protein YdbL (DUF1318 family)